MSAKSGPPRFLADEDFRYDIVVGMRRAQPSIDVLTASEAKTLGLSDPDVLAWARAHDRILITHDKRTMPDHFYRLVTDLAADEHCPGVMLISQDLAIGVAISALLDIWALSSHEEWRDVLTRVPL